MYLLAVRSIFRKGHVSCVKDVNEQISTEDTVFYAFVKISLIYTITLQHKPSSSTQLFQILSNLKYFQPIYSVKKVILLQFC